VWERRPEQTSWLKRMAKRNGEVKVLQDSKYKYLFMSKLGSKNGVIELRNPNLSTKNLLLLIGRLPKVKLIERVNMNVTPSYVFSFPENLNIIEQPNVSEISIEAKLFNSMSKVNMTLRNSLLC